MPIRLRRGGAYLADLNTLRRQVKANGPLRTVLPVTVSHPASPDAVDLYLNLAYEPASNRVRPPTSLCVLGFRNPHGAWCFKVPGVTSLPYATALDWCDGSYEALGHPRELPAITNADLGADVAMLAVYSGEPIGKELQDSLVRMMIVVSEALRFDRVAEGVNAVLVNEGSFRPNLAVLRAWDGHTLGT